MKRQLQELKGQLDEEQLRIRKLAIDMLSIIPRTGDDNLRLYELEKSDARFILFSETFKASVRGHRKSYDSTDFCEPAKLAIAKISMVENPDMEPNSIAAVVQKGWKLNERLVRPAMVMVVKGNETKPPE